MSTTKAKVSIFILKTLEKTYAQIRTDLEMNIKTKYITTSWNCLCYQRYQKSSFLTFQLRSTANDDKSSCVIWKP